MAGTGGTTSYSPISILTGTTLLPPKPATPTTVKPTVVVSQPTQGGGLTTTAPKPVVISQPTQGGGSSGSASTTAKKPTTPTLSEMMGSSGTASSSSAKKPTTNTLSQMMGSSGTAKAATTTKAPTAQQKQAINSLAGLDKAAQSVPGQTKDAIGKAYMAALAASVKSGGAGAVPDPKGLTSAEIDKYRSQFFSNLYSNQPVQQIIEPMDMAQATQAYDINKRIDPKILDYLNSGFPRPAPAPQAPQFINTVPMGMGLGYAQTPVGGMPGVTQGVRPEGPVGGLPAVSAYGPGVIPGPMPQQQYVAPGNQVIAQPRPTPAPAGGGYTTDMLNSKGIARYLLQDMMGQQRSAAPAAPAIVAQQQGGGGFDLGRFLVGQANADEYTGGETGGVYDLTKIPPTPAPRPVNIAEVTIPLDELMRRTREEAGLGAGKVPTDPAEFAALVNAGLEGLGAYDPATGRMVIADPNGPVAQAAKQELLNPKPFDFVGETARDVFAPYIAAATERRIPYPATDVPPDLTAPGNISAQGIGAERGISAAVPRTASSVSPQGIGAERGIAISTPYAAEQQAAIDAILAGGQAAAAVPTPANRQGQYGALDDMLSGRLFEQWTAEGEAQRAKRLAEGVDPNNFVDNMLWSMGLYRPQPGTPTPPPQAPAPPPVSQEDRLSPGEPLEFKDPNAAAQFDPVGVAPSFADVLSSAGITQTGSANDPTYWNKAGDIINSGTGLSREDTAATTDEVMRSSGPEGDANFQPGFEAQVTAAAGANRTPTGAKRFTPAEGQIVGTNGYIYEVTGTDAQGKPTYKNVGKVPGYTDAQLYKAANRGAFRDPNNIPQGGTTPKPPSALRTWARAQLDKYNAEIAKKKAEAEAKGEKYDPVSFMDYLQLAGSAATGNVAGLLMKGGQMVYPQILEWLANGPAYSTSRDDDEPMMDGSPSSSSSKKTSKNGDKKDEGDGTGTGTGGSGGSGGSGYTPTGGSLEKGYTMADFPYLLPYLQAVFPPSTYRPGVDPEWNYYPGSERAYAQGGAVSTPRLVLGPGGPREDKIPAKIDGVHEAKLSNGEFVITAAAVKGIGGGDMKRGAAELMKLNDMFSQRPDSGRLNVEKVR